MILSLFPKYINSYKFHKMVQVLVHFNLLKTTNQTKLRIRPD